MKKILLISCLIALASSFVVFSSCKKENVLKGTGWKGTTADGQFVSLSFLSETGGTYLVGSSTTPFTCTYNKSKRTGTIVLNAVEKPFSISGDILTYDGLTLTAKE